MKNKNQVQNSAVKQKSTWKKLMNIFLILITGVMGVIGIVAGVYVYRNMNYADILLRKIMKAGFVEKQASLPDGTVLNYAEGPNNGPALLLIHGQAVSWEDYSSVLPKLSKYYHIYAVDCHGHGDSSKNSQKYRANLMGEDFAWFIEIVIGEPAVVSGHSSGGLLAAWLAGNKPEWVRGVVLEDPPFFTTEAGNYQKTFAWVDTFQPIHEYLANGSSEDYVLYYLEHSKWLTFFGDARNGIIQSARAYRTKHPDVPIKIFYLPPSITNIFRGLDNYDPRFGETFYDASWNENYDHAETLAKITCPSVLIHTNWSYDSDGILLAAMSGEDAQKAHELIPDNVLINVDSGHDVHFEKPKEFTQIMIDFLDKIKD
jgi:pimeloyl-ACP methyl ester carboxylesterase